MTLKDLIQQIDRVRAQGAHPLTEVVITDGDSIVDVGTLNVVRGRVEISPAYDPAPTEDES